MIELKIVSETQEHYSDFVKMLSEPEVRFGLELNGSKAPSLEEAKEYQGKWLKASEKGEAVVLIAENDEGMGVGRIALEFANKFNLEKKWHVAKFSLFVDKNHWGKGVAKELLESAFQECAKKGIKRIEGRVHSDNKRALAFYEKMGFQVEGTAKNAVFKEGKFVDSVYIAKLL